MERYYPPTPENLTNANADVTLFGRNRDCRMLDSIAHILGTVAGRCFNDGDYTSEGAYMDIQRRALALRDEVLIVGTQV